MAVDEVTKLTDVRFNFGQDLFLQSFLLNWNAPQSVELLDSAVY